MDNNKEPHELHVKTGGLSRFRWLSIVMAGIGIGAGLAYLLSSALRRRPEESVSRRFPDNSVDDRGTGQDQAAQMLRNLRDRAFQASDEKLALALGRPLEKIVALNAGEEVIDDDIVMKARGIAMHRGVQID